MCYNRECPYRHSDVLDDLSITVGFYFFFVATNEDGTRKGNTRLLRRFSVTPKIQRLCLYVFWYKELGLSFLIISSEKEPGPTSHSHIPG